MKTEQRVIESLDAVVSVEARTDGDTAVVKLENIAMTKLKFSVSEWTGNTIHFVNPLSCEIEIENNGASTLIQVLESALETLKRQVQEGSKASG